MYSYILVRKGFDFKRFVANKINFYEKGNLTRYLLPKNIVFKRRLNHSQRFSNVKRAGILNTQRRTNYEHWRNDARFCRRFPEQTRPRSLRGRVETLSASGEIPAIFPKRASGSV